jgi:hypothetical protein
MSKKPTLNLYEVQEFHRGKWMPLKFTDRSGKESTKTVKITEEVAELMSIDAESDLKLSKTTKHFRYAKVDKAAKDAEKAAKKAEKDAEKAAKEAAKDSGSELPSYIEQKKILKDAGVKFKSNAKKADLEAIYVDYVKSQEGDK